MSELLAKRCHVHLDREAAARCPECKQFYCRECVTEHEDIVICTACLKKQIGGEEKKRLGLGFIVRGLAGAVGTVLCWICFLWVGKLLLAIPSEFHDGNLWRVGFMDQ